MRFIEVGAGTVTITDETILIDIGAFGSLKRFQEQSKLFLPFFIFGLLLVLYMAVFDSWPLRELARFVVIFTISGFTLDSLLPKMWDDIRVATEIRRTNVERVEYTSSRLFGLKLRIIVVDGETTGVRPVPLAYRQLGEQQLENAIQAFEDADISVIPTEDTTDDES